VSPRRLPSGRLIDPLQCVGELSQIGFGDVEDAAAKRTDDPRAADEDARGSRKPPATSSFARAAKRGAETYEARAVIAVGNAKALRFPVPARSGWKNRLEAFGYSGNTPYLELFERGNRAGQNGN